MFHYLKTFIFLGTLLGIGLLLWRQLLTPQARGWIDYRFAVVIPLVAVGLFAPSVWVYYGAVFLAMAVLPRSRIEAAGLFIFLALMLPLVTHDLRIGSALILRVEGRMAAALGLLAALRLPAMKGQGRSGVNIIVALFVMLQIVIASRIANTGAATVARSAISIVLTLGVPYLLAASATPADRDMRRPMFYLMAVGLVLSVVAAFEMLRHWPLYQTIDANLGTVAGLSKTLALRGGLLRAPGPFFESTGFGAILAITTICTAAIRSVFRSREMHLVAIAIGCMGCFATLSRNALLGVTIGLIVVGLYRGRVGKALGAGIVIVAATGALIVAAPDSGLVASLAGKGNTTAASTAEYRQDLFVKTIPVIKSSPWIGTPYDRVRDMMQFDLSSGALKVDYVNSYLYYAVASGFVGLSVFVVLLFYPIFLLLAGRRRLAGSAVDVEVGAALFGALVAMSAMVIAASFFERLPLVVILLIGMTRALLMHAGQATPATSATSGGARTAPLVVDPMRPRLTLQDG